MFYRLVVLDAGRPASHTLAAGEVVVGSGADCAIRLGHPTVSRRHARLIVGESAVSIEDLESSNGTFCDGRRLSGCVLLDAPVELGFGTVVARLERLDPDDAVPAVTLGAAAEVEPPAGRTATTIQSASIQRLVTEMLPRWVEALEAELDIVQMAQRLGGSLFETLPLVSFELSLAGEGGTIYRAEALPARSSEASAGDPERSSSVHFSGRVIHGVASFPHAVQARAYRPVVESAIRFLDLARPARRPVDASTGSVPSLPEPITVVPEVRSLYADAARVALGDISVLITGESGTGKEVLARYLHDGSTRRSRSFVALNCAALPRDLLEAELFGIEDGVATGVKARPGCFERADGGTLLLDEIGDMAAETQARILRVLQEGEVFRLGGRAPRSADVRVLAATNRDIDAQVADGTFRTDLYHRIADWRVDMPPLRRRREDILNLAVYFLTASATKRGLAPIGVSKRAAEWLAAYDWPGNIRQLEREMARVVLFLEAGEMLQSRHLSDAVRHGTSSGSECERSLKERLAAAEARILQDEIRAQKGNVREAARILDIGRSTLYRRITEMGLDIDED